MNAVLLLLTCFAAIVIPIISVQLPRYFKYQDSVNASKTNPPQNSAQIKKPWNPPFPTISPLERKTNGGWLVLPPILPRMIASRNGNEDNSMDSRSASDHKSEPIRRQKKDAGASSKIGREAGAGGISILWICLSALAGVLIILAISIFFIHILAWFIVYKTEARLGEARTGLVQGGEMRLCLYAR